MKQPTGIFWQSDAEIKSWSEAAAAHLNRVLGAIFGRLSVELLVPDASTAKRHATANLDLLGKVILKWNEMPAEAATLEIPLPYHGLFIKRQEKTGLAGFAVWGSWLGERPGFRYFRKHGEANEVFWRVGLPGGNHVQSPCGALINGKEGAFPEHLCILPSREAWPSFLQPAYDLNGLVELAPTEEGKKGEDKKEKRERSGGFWRLIHYLAARAHADARATGVQETDEDDLNYRVLVTFPAWLNATLARALVTTLLDVSGDNVNALLQAIKHRTAIDNGMARGLWQSLLQEDPSEALAMRLRPRNWSRGSEDEGETRFAPLQWIDPINPVDLAALLTQVRRYPMAHSALGNLPANYRQNHPSFRGCICPVQSPESELVGLSLNLTRGAKVNWEGIISPADRTKPNGELGLGAGLVPFYEHNDGVRCMMGAKNLRQAVPVAGRQSPLVKSGGEQAVQDLVNPLVEIGACPAAVDEKGALALGVDLLVAYLPWKGMNVDDAIVVGQQVVGHAVSDDGPLFRSEQTVFQEGLLDIQLAQRFKVLVEPGWSISWLAPEGSMLFGGDLIARFELKSGKKDIKREIFYQDRSPARVRSILPPNVPEWMRGTFNYELVKYLKLGLGDKLMGRHGNKGVVGAILPKDQMPRLPKDKSLPANLQGRPIDILLNPHGVISRMNLGQLLETHVGWLMKAGCKPEQLMKNGMRPDDPIGQPFLQALDHAKVQHLLSDNGLDRFGRIQLVLPDETRTLAPVVVGFQHIVRLKHVPELKSQARRGGEGSVYSRDTGQAVHGRLIGGGQRVGEMEVWALAGYQADHILEEMLGVKADSILAGQLLGGEPKVTQKTFEGFPQRLKDWLFSLLIDLRAEAGRFSFAFVDETSARKRIGERKKVINSESVRKLVLASFSCQSGMKGGCPFELLDGARIAVKERAKSNQVSLKLEEFLDHLGLVIDGPLRRKGSGYYVRLCSKAEPSSDGTLAKAFDLENDRIAHAQGFARPAGLLKVSVNPTTDQVKATIALDPKDRPSNWPDSVVELPLYAQFTRPSSTFAVGDVVDVPRFTKRLKKENPDAVTSFLLRRLSAETKRCLDDGQEVSHLQESLVADLNEVVSGESIYEDQRFSSVRLRPETSQLLNSKPHRKELRKLNRMLLEDAFPDMLARGKDGPESSNMDAILVLREFLKHNGMRRFGQMSVACPNGHNTIPLKGKAPFGEKLGIAAGGLFDESLFGSFKAAGTIDDKKNWAYIELPVDVPYPAAAFLGPNEDVGKFFAKHQVPRKNLPPVRVIPVLPPRYRMLFLGSNSATRDPLIHDGYAPILRACQQYEMAADDARKADALRVLTNAVEELFRLVAGRLSGKEGLIRRDGLGRRVDRSARLVIIPNPELHWDEAGVPTAVLLELMGPELEHWMKAKRESGDLVETASVLTNRQSEAAILAGWSWRKSGKDRSLLEQGRKLLVRFLEAHPDVLVVLNRQPSLHRNSIQAFRPKPLSPEVGEVLQLSPLVCKGFGADFDGDEMAIHVPLSAASRADAERMLPSKNMLSLAIGEVLPSEENDDKIRTKSRRELGLSTKSYGVLAQYEQDFVLGLYWSSRKESGFKERLLAILPKACCHEWVGGQVLDQKNGADLLEHLVNAHHEAAAEVIWKLSNLAFECCSKLGVSFGFYELTKLANQCHDKSVDMLRGFKNEEPGGLNAQLNKLVRQPLLDLVEQRPLNGAKDIFEHPGLHFAAMALSGARGKQQVRQLIASRGFLSPGMVDFESPNDRFVVQSALANGMSAEEAFFGAMNSRSSMCDKKLGTRKAGYLTRRLVTALWPVGVVEDDCGNTSKSRSPVTCLCTEGICAACYGDLPGETRPAIGFPAGLIAAQSIGERGTQLSMQSFHTGQKVFSMQDVQRCLDHTGEVGAVFTREDILDVEALVARFKQPSESDKISQYLTARLKGQTKQLFKEFTGGDNKRVERAVLGILNRTLRKIIYDPQRFEGITLSSEIAELIEATSRPQKPDHAKQPETPKIFPCAGLNRMLLECAYPRELAKRPGFFYHHRFASEFVRAMKASDAYKGLDDRHLEILWRAIHSSPEKSLRSVTKSGGLLTRIGFERQRRHILLAACKNESASANEPAARVLFNLFGSRTRGDERKSK